MVAAAWGWVLIVRASLFSDSMSKYLSTTAIVLFQRISKSVEGTTSGLAATGVGVKIRVTLGDPVDLSQFEGLPLTPETLHAATDRIMDAVTALVAELRGEPAPATRVDPREDGLASTGDAHVVYDFSPHRPDQPGPDAGGKR